MNMTIKNFLFGQTKKRVDNQGFIKKLDEYNMIGNVLIVLVDYNKNSVRYYFCPQNLKQYRKVRGENARKIKKVKATFNCK